MKIIFLAVFLAFAQAKQFSVKDDSKNVCLLLDVDGTLNLTAKDKDNKTFKASFKLVDAQVKNDSDCSLIKLDLGNSSEVWFQFNNASESSKVTPLSTFVPESVFGVTVNTTVAVVAAAPSLGDFMKNQSFACKAEVEHDFKPSNTSKDFEFTVTATTKGFQIQNSGLVNGTFGGDAQHCDQDDPTTPNTTPTTPTTPKPPQSNFTCKSGNDTKIQMVGKFQLSITYEANVKGRKKNITKLIDVPDTAKAMGECLGNETKESLTISFFNDWSIKYDFVSDSKADNVGDKYHVSNITIKYTYDEHLPDAVEAIAGKNVTVMYEAKDGYLKATSKGYYQCNSNSSVSVDQVTLYTSDLKYKAFGKGDAGFSGDTFECSADEETSSVVPIAVGASLAGLVVIVLIAYLIGRKRARKSGYESV